MNISDVYKIIYTEPRIFTKEELDTFKFDIKDKIIDCNISYRIYNNYVTIHPTIMEYYIIKYHRLPQDELCYDPSICSEKGDLPAMIWISCVRSIPPEKIFPDKLIRSKIQDTCAMHWINTLKSLPPPELLHAPDVKGCGGMTCAMQWICYVKTMPPAELLHEAALQDDQGCTCAMWWIQFVKTVPPIPLLHDRRIKNKYMMDLAFSWEYYVKTKVPEILIPDPSLPPLHNGTASLKFVFDPNFIYDTSGNKYQIGDGNQNAEEFTISYDY